MQSAECKIQNANRLASPPTATDVPINQSINQLTDKESNTWPNRNFVRSMIVSSSKPVEAEERTAGGIVLPDTAKEKPQRGKVVSVGPGKLFDNGQRGSLSVAIGDEVIYGKYSGTDIELDGDDVKILRETDILAKVMN